MNDKANLISIVLGTLGVLFMMAMAFSILPTNLAIFASIACFIIAGAVKRLAAQ
ncbi:MAG: hypothetical protein ACJ74J_04955 [Blastocatellia bacterium]